MAAPPPAASTEDGNGRQSANNAQQRKKKVVFTGQMTYSIVSILRQQEGWRKDRAHGFCDRSFCDWVQQKL